MHDNSGESLLTGSLCPICRKVIPAAIRNTTHGALMEKTCPDHGPFSVVVSTDVATYERLGRTPRKVTKPLKHLASGHVGCPDDCGLCARHDQHTCLAILEITSRCDLGCPICITGSGPIGSDLDVAQVEFALKRLIDFEGNVTPLQISGGEPTLHPQLQDIVKRAASLGFGKIELDTNGISLAKNRFLAEQLRDAGLCGVYLQMDGTDSGVFESVRGRNLFEEKLRAIEYAKKSELQIVLAVTVVPGVNDHSMWEMVKFGMDNGLTGVNFQAVTLSGRFPQALLDSPNRFTLAHFLDEMERQSEGMLSTSDLMPIPCPDGRCGAMSYALVDRGTLVPLRRIVDDRTLLHHLAGLDDWETVIREIVSKKEGGCACRLFRTGHASAVSDLTAGFDFFAIGFHGMMDGYSFDLERVRRCCVHELTPEGKLVPFCLYNIKRGVKYGCC